MHHHPVKSSRIISVAYDDASATLEICFYHQPPLQYTGVPPRIFRDFLEVVSKGRFYDGVIKGKFPERKPR
ncbi:KTSC domain-containing protein [Klebsiella quasipneumoniae]|uniref:KTSC domain-containing protein n=1 Tax=Klebsiella quasipneumoniae TaxID=1463165 RepID=UPI0021817447|nr:KTSC domain-containing protein [Klebsiella quasipneumoniae]GKO67068.1 KTSC domain-containing protein [Klebsiella quasipneumoniae]HCI8805494.1 KTSC domain-containing protein [Klebsiella quasipneumoniae]